MTKKRFWGAKMNEQRDFRKDLLHPGVGDMPQLQKNTKVNQQLYYNWLAS